MPENPLIPPILETQRLRLRRRAMEDVKGLHALYGDPETVRFWTVLPARDERETADRIAQSLKISTEDYACWAILSKESGQFIGMVNYHNRSASNRRLAIGWNLGSAHWRQGYMSEAIPPVLDYCFNSLEAHRIEAVIQPEDTSSIGLAERLGFRWEGGLMRHRLLVGDSWRDVRMYALLEDEWRAGRAKRAAQRAARP